MSAFCGTWGESVISTNGNHLTITMGSRPNATGTLTSATTATVRFPDDQTLNATLANNNCIQWSNGSHWERR